MSSTPNARLIISTYDCLSAVRDGLLPAMLIPRSVLSNQRPWAAPDLYSTARLLGSGPVLICAWPAPEKDKRMVVMRAITVMTTKIIIIIIAASCAWKMRSLLANAENGPFCQECQ